MSVKLANHLIQKLGYGNQNRLNCLSRVIVDKNQRFIYNRIRKNANTLVTNFVFSQRNLSDQDAVATKITGQTAKRETPNLSNTLLLQNLSGFESLLIIRDPKVRTLSAFLQKFAHQSYQEKYGEYELTPEGFERFLTWLEAGNITANAHWDCQSAEFAFPIEFFKHIIRFEDLGTKLPPLFRELGYNTDILANDEFQVSSGRHKTRSDERAKEFISKDNARRIEKLYALDYQNFGSWY